MLLSFDQGTTSSRALVFDDQGAIVSVAQREFAQIFPQPGWVEHDPEEIVASQFAVAIEAMAKANVQPREVRALGITNQRETTIIWHRSTGSRCTTRSFGKTGVPPIFAVSSNRKGTKI